MANKTLKELFEENREKQARFRQERIDKQNEAKAKKEKQKLDLIKQEEAFVEKRERDAKKNRFFWYSISIGVLIVFLLMLLSSVLDVGERLGGISSYVEIAFYVIVGLLVYFLILNPIRIIVFAPSFSVQSILDDEETKPRAVYKKVARNLIRSGNLLPDDIALIKEKENNAQDLREALTLIFNRTIKKQLNKIIINNAKTVMISTAISQNGRLDMITVMVVNIKMIKELVVKCGFRPSFKNLSKLTINVFATALIAEGLEGLDFNELFPNTTTGIFADIPFIKPITSSIIQGISNALLTARIGIVARKYLLADGREITKTEIRKESLKESIGLMPQVVTEGMTNFPERIRKMFTKEASSTEHL
ncbi:MAG TPA: YcjF family protein [Bacilli bacterium]|nr:YcjF family protein [Bacilli bacterium]